MDDDGRQRVEEALADDLPVSADHEHLGTEREELGYRLRLGHLPRLQHGQAAFERGELDRRGLRRAVAPTWPSSTAAVILRTVTPSSVSPAMSARSTGAAQRKRGTSEGWTATVGSASRRRWPTICQ